MPAAITKSYWLTNVMLLVSLAAAMMLAMLAPVWIRSEAAVWILAIIGLAFVAGLLTLTAIASFGDDEPGNTFSELLRESTVESTFYPWALSVYMGRWFHPVDDLTSPLGVWGPILLMTTTWGIVVTGGVLARTGKRLWPWLVVLLGFTIGIVTWPA